jgi:hypothetical protein
MTSKKINGRRSQKIKWKTISKNKMEDKPINLIGCDTIVNSPSSIESDNETNQTKINGISYYENRKVEIEVNLLILQKFTSTPS